MNTTRDEQQNPQARTARQRPRRRWGWRWQAVAAVLLALVVADGQSIVSTYAASSIATRAADAARRVATPVIRPVASPSPTGGSEASGLLDVDLQPDFQVSFTHIEHGQAGMPLRYTLQFKNVGQVGGMATVSTLVPPELSNVRVSAPGFACTRRFAASGEEAGTLVTCTRNEMDAGESASLTIEANAPTTAAEYDLTATADPRDEAAEADESNNAADAMLRVRG